MKRSLIELEIGESCLIKVTRSKKDLTLSPISGNVFLVWGEDDLEMCLGMSWCDRITFEKSDHIESEFVTYFNSLPEEQKRDVIATLFARVIPEDIFIHLVFELNLEENANQVIELVKGHHDRLPKGDAK